MPEEKDIKTIPPLTNRSLLKKDVPIKECWIQLAGIFSGYLLLLVVITFLPLDSFLLKLIGLLGGFFLLEDLHRTIKFRLYG